MNDYNNSRIDEWFVPKFGPLKFRLFCGLLFLPYTGMCVSFVIMGNLISSSVDIERLIAISIIYFVSLGLAAHVADSIGSRKVKPWGDLLNKKQAWIIIGVSLVFSYSLGLYYAIIYSPLLIIIGAIEGFFLFAYNFEIFRGLFHNNFWFSVSWGVLPFFAGYIIQTNNISLEAIIISIIPFTLSYVEIHISRKYKKNRLSKIYSSKTSIYELVLKILSLGTVLITSILLFVHLSKDVLMVFLSIYGFIYIV